MFAALGQIGKALLPQLLTVGSKMLSSSSLGSTLKKFGNSQLGGITKNIFGAITKGINQAPSQKPVQQVKQVLDMPQYQQQQIQLYRPKKTAKRKPKPIRKRAKRINSDI